MSSKLLKVVNLDCGVRKEDLALEIINLLNEVDVALSDDFINDKMHLGGKILRVDRMKISIYPVSSGDTSVLTHYEVECKLPGDEYLRTVFMAEQFVPKQFEGNKYQKKLMPAVFILYDAYWINYLNNISIIL